MVLIPAGEFMMGSPPGEGDRDERPQRKVYVDSFCMDKYEVALGWGRGRVKRLSKVKRIIRGTPFEFSGRYCLLRKISDDDREQDHHEDF